MCTTRLLPLAAGLVVAACYGPDRFQEESALARCALYEECGYLTAIGVDDYDACLELLRSEAYACVTYEPTAGRACVEALETLSCEAYGSGEFPMACVDACAIEE